MGAHATAPSSDQTRLRAHKHARGVGKRLALPAAGCAVGDFRTERVPLTNRNHGRVLLLQREATGEERRPLGAARAGWQLASDVVERGVVGRAGGYVTARADSEAPLRARAVAASLPVAVRVAALCGSLPTAWMRTQDGAPHRRPL